GGIDDPLLVDGDSRKWRHGRAGGDDDILRADLLVADLDRVPIDEARAALEPFDLVLLEQEFDALGKALHGLEPRRVHLAEVELDLRRLHAPFGERPVMRFLEQFRGVEQSLRRDAADVEAGAAERLAALGAGGLQPELCRADRGDIAAGAGADHQDVEIETLRSHSKLRSP